MKAGIWLLSFARLVAGSETINHYNDQLLRATLEGDVKEILSLVERGANPNIMLALQTPLAAVCNAGNIEGAKELIRLGADPNFGDFTHYSLLVAIESANFDLVQALINSGSLNLSHSATLLAVYNGPFEIVKLLVDNFGFDSSHPDIASQVKMLLSESCQRGVPTIFDYIMRNVTEELVNMRLKWSVMMFVFTGSKRISGKSSLPLVG